jgi:hypothetical protein
MKTLTEELRQGAPRLKFLICLESTPDIAAASIWSSVTNPRATNLNAFLVTVPMTNVSQFFRLKHR